MALNNKQKRFIKEKVKTFGAIQKVKGFYKRDSPVCQYAHDYAMKIFKKET